MNKSKIEWCDYTWNPLTGCYHDCKYCYAKKIANRFGNHDVTDLGNEMTIQLNTKPSNPYPYKFIPTFHKYRLEEPAQKTKGKKIFVCSMADLFGDWVPNEWIEEVFNACFEAGQHQYMFLTKNPKKINESIEYFENEERGFGLNEGYWNNFWFGTSVTCQDDIERIKYLEFSEGHKFLSIEPLLSDIKLDLSGYCCPKCGSINVYNDNPKTTPKGIPAYYCDDCGEWEGDKPKGITDWAIIGAQSGPGAVKPKPEWIRSIVEQCNAAGVPVFMKNSLKPYWEGELIQEWPEG